MSEPAVRQSSIIPVPLVDAYAPSQIAVRVHDVRVAKATAPLLTIWFVYLRGPEEQ